jgi:hypothetical protein
MPESVGCPDSPVVEWWCLADILKPHFTGGLFTILAVDRSRNLVHRSYSSNETSYPRGGDKALMSTPWAELVIGQRQRFLASTEAEMKWAFSDHQKLFDLGYTTAMNLPIQQGTGVAWTVNLLRGGSAYSERECEVVSAAVQRWIQEIHYA